jgi:hypothetical protein
MCGIAWYCVTSQDDALCMTSGTVCIGEFGEQCI